MPAIEPASRALKFLLMLLSVVVLLATLSAGLWPFSFHQQNQAWWKPEKGGLALGTGMAISSGKFSGLPTSAEKGCSIELWVEPTLDWDASTLLSFYNLQATSRIQLRQSGDDFAFHGLPPEASGVSR